MCRGFLLIDSDLASAAAMAAALCGSGAERFQVEVEPRLERGPQLLEAQPFDCVLLDPAAVGSDPVDVVAA